MCLSRARQRRRYHSRGFSFFSYLFARKHATGASETTNGGREGANKRANEKEKERERDRGRNVRTECARMRDRDWEKERKTETRCNKKKEKKRVRGRRKNERYYARSGVIRSAEFPAPRTGGRLRIAIRARLSVKLISPTTTTTIPR